MKNIIMLRNLRVSMLTIIFVHLFSTELAAQTKLPSTLNASLEFQINIDQGGEVYSDQFERINFTSDFDAFDNFFDYIKAKRWCGINSIFIYEQIGFCCFDRVPVPIDDSYSHSNSYLETSYIYFQNEKVSLYLL